MPAKYYRDKLYPFQDRVLKLIQELDVGFYLTGGTALGRCFLNHRYADDFKNHGVVSNSTAQGDQMDKTGESEEKFWRLFNMNKVDTLESMSLT